MMKRCMTMAKEDKLKTIAFPTVGHGNLGYSAKEVAGCFIEAAMDAGAGLKVKRQDLVQDLYYGEITIV